MGPAQPDDQATVWALMREATYTLRRLPDREQAFLTAGERSGCRSRRGTGVAFAASIARLALGEAERARVRPALPSRAAIERLQLVIGWLAHVRARDRRPAVQLLWLASGVRMAKLSEHYGVSRQALYQARDAACRQIAVALRKSRLTDLVES